MSIGSTPWLHKNSVAVTKNYYAIKSLTFWGHIILQSFLYYADNSRSRDGKYSFENQKIFIEIIVFDRILFM